MSFPGNFGFIKEFPPGQPILGVKGIMSFCPVDILS